MVARRRIGGSWTRWIFLFTGQKCGASESEMFTKIDTITHLNAGKKFVLKVDWTISENVGPVQFMFVRQK